MSHYLTYKPNKLEPVGILFGETPEAIRHAEGMPDLQFRPIQEGDWVRLTDGELHIIRSFVDGLRSVVRTRRVLPASGESELASADVTSIARVIEEAATDRITHAFGRAGHLPRCGYLAKHGLQSEMTHDSFVGCPRCRAMIVAVGTQKRS